MTKKQENGPDTVEADTHFKLERALAPDALS